MKCLILTSQLPFKINELVDQSNYDFVIGCDKAAIVGIVKKFNVDVAIGDFDSVNEKEMRIINELAGEVIKLDEYKDFTDTEEAIKYAYNNGATSVDIYGGISGDRIEHLFANINMLKKYENVSMSNEFSTIYVTSKSFEVQKNNDYFYSFFAAMKVTGLTLSGFKYSLYDYNLDIDDSLCVSNELIDEKGMVRFNSGKLIVIKTLKKA